MRNYSYQYNPQDESYSYIMKRHRQQNQKSEPSVSTNKYYDAVRKEIGNNSSKLTPDGIRKSIEIYHGADEADRLTDKQLYQIMTEYENSRGWG
jgi:hypothetical protein